jgi:cobalt-zinc-cadmium efflux system membrane fusion protein
MKNILFITIFSFALLSSCKKTSEDTTDKHQETEHHDDHIKVTQEQFDANAMQLETLTKQRFPKVVKATGMIDVPPQSIEVITSFSGGYIKKSALLIGDKVKKGQALVTIENPEFVEMQQEYLEIAAQLSYLKSEYERQKTLFDEQITSQKSYLKAQSEYKTKLAMYNGKRKRLRMLNINPTSVEQGKITSVITLYATISGSVTKVNVSKGTYVSPADEIMQIVNTDHIHIELTVFEKDVMNIKEEQHISFKIPEASNKIFEAEVHLVGTVIDETTRTVKVHGHLHEDEKNTFAIGMFVDAEIELSNKTALAILEDAILEDDHETHVLVLEHQENGNYTFKKVEVEVGKKHKGFVEIISDNIKPTDKILTKGAYALVGVEGGGHNH